MFLIKILGNDKTANLNVEIRYKDIVSVMSDIEKIDEVVNTTKNINDPITMNLSTLLQLCCQFTLKPDVVKYLLELGSNPLQYDANGCNAYDYVDDNEYGNEKLKEQLKELLNQYKDLYTREDKEKRKLLGWNWLSVGCDFCKQHRFD